MVSTQKNFDTLAELYNVLIKYTMYENGITEIRCDSSNKRFYDRIVLNEGGRMDVYKYGLKKPFSNLGFDFTVDYAKCLLDIEESLYVVERGGEPKHGIVFEFKNSK